MIDTHAHLNFSRFKKNVEEVLEKSRGVGVEAFVVPGTDIASSRRALELAKSHSDVWAAVGIHPHHVYNYLQKDNTPILEEEPAQLKTLAANERVVAIGEIGLDRYVYEETKYETYAISEKFLNLQRSLCAAQIELARELDKSVIVHNREAADELVSLLKEHWDSYFEHRMVFHCCEPRDDLLDWAQKHGVYIGVDGDVTYWKEKQEFVKKIPLAMLVLETDSPFLLPEPLKSQKMYPNTPVNMPLIVRCVADLKGESEDKVKEATLVNAKILFKIKKSAL